jgi:transposase InsO family protein
VLGKRYVSRLCSGPPRQFFACTRLKFPGRITRRVTQDVKYDGERSASAIWLNVLARQFAADQPNRKWIADFTYVWTAEGWLYVAAVIDLFSRRLVGWSMKAEMSAQLVTDA